MEDAWDMKDFFVQLGARLAGLWNVWYIDRAHLSANYFSDTTDGMTLVASL